ncbi:hypothetical protein BCR33DRAFT_14455 [Rhizoclosmatium globosum]|uniref:Uncharacterized protein n=1 Tax=Rhizoclosmatium globosum TaxID=329046 RepID=A0A1Y2CQ21_9FUNG|nr:hypothetical protein BCR33DRAFT_14455 [Rhizoclosmatium globosum]|eukprot:ORY48934.1 hypothetical protein BCR33DRAFT_14455 [Rhizoclosmatium globosum]
MGNSTCKSGDYLHLDSLSFQPIKNILFTPVLNINRFEYLFSLSFIVNSWIHVQFIPFSSDRAESFDFRPLKIFVCTNRAINFTFFVHSQFS